MMCSRCYINGTSPYRNTHVRILFIDFSSAFNPIQPHILLQKLVALNVNRKLTMRSQYTKLKNIKSSDIAITNTGAPQGCVLAPLLFVLYTNDCRSKYKTCSMIKYADDTATVGKISNDD